MLVFMLVSAWASSGTNNTFAGHCQGDKSVEFCNCELLGMCHARNKLLINKRLISTPMYTRNNGAEIRNYTIRTRTSRNGKVEAQTLQFMINMMQKIIL